MDVVEPLRRDGERFQRGPDVAVYLGALAVEAGFGPGSDLLGEAMPHKLGGHKLDGRVGAWVRKAMECVEHSAAEGGRD